MVLTKNHPAAEQFASKDSKTGQEKQKRRRGTDRQADVRCGDLTLPDKTEAEEDAERGPLGHLGSGS